MLFLVDRNAYLDGAGTIGIFDFDTVEASNLHRQVLHTTARVGEYKAESAKAALTR
jgi:molybdopterin/thiamine biosynthesis adenylyltransferase